MKKSWACFVLSIVALFAVVIVIGGGCTAQDSAKSFGGTANVDLPQGQKLVNISWKDNDLWYLTKPMAETDVAETYTYQAQSSWGVFQGTVIVTEHK